MDKIVTGQQESYRPEATSRSMPKGVMTVSDMEYEPGDHTTFIIAEGPAKKQPGQYVLCVEHNERKVFHAYGEPSNQKGRGVVTDIEMPT